MKYLSDEPATKDSLGRDEIVTSFKQCVESCKTPFAIGLCGTWGTGKTTLMKLVKKELDDNNSTDPKILTIWFDTWQYQTTEDIEIALLYKTYKTFITKLKDSSIRSKVDELFIKTVNAFLALASGLKFSLGPSGLGFEVETKKIPNESEKVIEKNSSLEKIQAPYLARDNFEEFIEKIKKSLNVDKLVFFIDDLDRCSSRNAVKVLEYLKNYLNIDGCVYVLGLDKKTIKRHIEKENVSMSEEIEFLDKIIQLEFQIPIIDRKKLSKFVQSIYEENFSSECEEFLLVGLGENPRYIKRFINTLALTYNLVADDSINNNLRETIEKKFRKIEEKDFKKKPRKNFKK
ncbi:KAP family P-loop NTPase fold protein [Acaryochloris marina]|uniref:KAP family P-loop NTPase fold protein n=1 Tax=Acaryochloris marina TaxID=155978 RepID=UPI0021C37699|nr:KAP family NTPase [Acaryochloris marina]BDM83803.1 hypothetical protein AM10699_66640 [Acaryochloris marina MBIC10699]